LGGKKKNMVIRRSGAPGEKHHYGTHLKIQSRGNEGTNLGAVKASAKERRQRIVEERQTKPQK